MDNRHPAPPLNREARRAYVRKRKTYRLVFDNTEMAGLVVRARSLPLGSFMELVDLATVLDGANMDQMSAEDAGAIRQLFEGFAGALVSWNLEQPVVDPETGEETDETEPVPATVEGLYSQDMEFAMVIIQEWMSAVASVNDPLRAGSPSGGPSPEESLPMEPLSASQTS